MRDSEFIRGSLPMTKSEVRAVSLSKLELEPDCVFWDVGAGTGSVAVEAARQLSRMRAGKSRIYAIEKEEEGIALIKQNREKLVPEYDKIIPVHGKAPEVLLDLPAPSHVFIGGSGGKLREIVRVVLEKNPEARVVMNLVTAESLSECIGIIHAFPPAMHEIVQVAVTRLEPVGRYHMQKAQNPVYIAVLQGKTGQ